jgi:hypothetical protein
MLDLTPVWQLYTRWRTARLQRQPAAATQERQLLRLLRKAAATRFGRDHGFADIRSVAAYQARVPLRRYEDFWADYWQPAFPLLQDCSWPGVMPFFAQTSGTTTGITKYIPVSSQMIWSNRMATLDLVTHHFSARPASRLFAGRSFMLGGSTALTELAPGIWSGDLSGIAGKTVPWWARMRYFPPRELETIADWEEKIARFAPASLDANIRAIGGVPSWLLLFFEELARLRPNAGRSLAAFYPDLELLVHGGVNFAPYRTLFMSWLQGSRAEMREVYPASEGFVAVADRSYGEGLRLVLDHGLFFEFVPVAELDAPEPTRHWAATIETDVNYAIVLSTCAGLWSYIIGDTVRFVDRDPPRLLITGRTSYTLSAFGEHLIGEEIERAVATAAETIGEQVKDYSVGAVYPAHAGEPGGHLFIVEFAGGVPEAALIARFGAALDDTLSTINDDYRAHRSAGYGMRAPVVQPVAGGTFATWMKARGRLGGQNKVPRIINDGQLFDSLRAAADAG